LANLKQIARNLFDIALQECSVDRSFDRVLRTVTDAQGTYLVLDGQRLVDLNRLRRVRILSAGKASATMLSSLLSRLPLPPCCDVRGVLIAPVRPTNLPDTIQFFQGGHPLPNEASFAGASAALSMLRELGPASPDDTLCLFLVSGGASAMMELPLDASISLADTVAFHRALVASGATIVEMNCVRKHFSAVKGGRLALAAGDARKISLLVSDVPPAHIDALASGPTIPDPTTVAQCREIIARYSLLERFSPTVAQFFESPSLPESPKPGDVVSPTWKLLDSDELAAIAAAQATALGFHPVIDNTCDDWSCKAAADYLLERIRQLRREHPRACLISCGEVTITLPHSIAPTAAGGRNQHLALYLATRLTPQDGPIAILSAGSDGIDGNSPAAGAVIDQHTLDDSSTRVEAHRSLEAFDSNTLLTRLGATIITGPTGHNLRDLRILLAEPLR
jgi:glycerate 2-kinase